MTPRSVTEIQEDIVDEFSLFDDWQDKYAHIIDLGRELPELPEELKTESTIVRGCQSQVWLIARLEDGIVKLEADSDALIVKGLIALMLRLYGNQTPDTILETDASFLKQIGLDRHLSQNRTNGLHAMMLTIKRHALQFKSQANA